jgi:hypothetical protein
MKSPRIKSKAEDLGYGGTGWRRVRVLIDSHYWPHGQNAGNWPRGC